MKRFSRAQQEQHRVAVLTMDRQNPRPSNYKIASTVGISPSTVRSILKAFKDRGDDLGDRCRRGRKPKCSQRFMRCTEHTHFKAFHVCLFHHRHLIAICRKAKGQKTLKAMAKEMYEWELAAHHARPQGAVYRAPKLMSPQTVMRYGVSLSVLVIMGAPHRYLHKNGLRSIKTVKVPFLGPHHKHARLQFAKKNMALDWSKVSFFPAATFSWVLRAFPSGSHVECMLCSCGMMPQVRFSDEKRFCLRNDGPVHRWMRAEDKLVDGYTRGTSRMRVSIMVWLAIAADGRSKLLRCDHRQDSQSYIRKVLTPSLGFISPAPVTFQQDNASCHVSRETMAFLRAKRVKLLDQWPAMSPDLNLVEHCWAKLAQQMVGKNFATQDDLWVGVQEAWNQVPPSYVKGLYASMVRRLTAVVVAKGGNTKY